MCGLWMDATYVCEKTKQCVDGAYICNVCVRVRVWTSVCVCVWTD